MSLTDGNAAAIEHSQNLFASHDVRDTINSLLDGSCVSALGRSLGAGVQGKDGAFSSEDTDQFLSHLDKLCPSDAVDAGGDDRASFQNEAGVLQFYKPGLVKGADQESLQSPFLYTRKYPNKLFHQQKDFIAYNKQHLEWERPARPKPLARLCCMSEAQRARLRAEKANILANTNAMDPYYKSADQHDKRSSTLGFINEKCEAISESLDQRSSIMAELSSVQRSASAMKGSHGPDGSLPGANHSEQEDLSSADLKHNPLPPGTYHSRRDATSVELTAESRTARQDSSSAQLDSARRTIDAAYSSLDTLMGHQQRDISHNIRLCTCDMDEGKALAVESVLFDGNSIHPHADIHNPYITQRHNIIDTRRRNIVAQCTLSKVMSDFVHNSYLDNTQDSASEGSGEQGDQCSTQGIPNPNEEYMHRRLQEAEALGMKRLATAVACDMADVALAARDPNTKRAIASLDVRGPPFAHNPGTPRPVVFTGARLTQSARGSPHSSGAHDHSVATRPESSRQALKPNKTLDILFGMLRLNTKENCAASQDKASLAKPRDGAHVSAPSSRALSAPSNAGGGQSFLAADRHGVVMGEQLASGILSEAAELSQVVNVLNNIDRRQQVLYDAKNDSLLQASRVDIPPHVLTGLETAVVRSTSRSSRRTAPHRPASNRAPKRASAKRTAPRRATLSTAAPKPSSVSAAPSHHLRAAAGTAAAKATRAPAGASAATGERRRRQRHDVRTLAPEEDEYPRTEYGVVPEPAPAMTLPSAPCTVFQGDDHSHVSALARRILQQRLREAGNSCGSDEDPCLANALLDADDPAIPSKELLLGAVMAARKKYAARHGARRRRQAAARPRAVLRVERLPTAQCRGILGADAK